LAIPHNRLVCPDDPATINRLARLGAVHERGLQRRLRRSAMPLGLAGGNGSITPRLRQCAISIRSPHAMLMKMPEGENKTNGMQEMTSAKSSMSQKDMAGCQDHMNKAMKMGMMRSKKM
jgi:hypothetical protein